MKKWKLVLTQGVVAGSLSSVLSTALLAFFGRRQAGSAAAPLNAVSHWYWGDEAFHRQQADLGHTAVGYATHHVSATFWATVHAALASKHPALRTAPGLILGAAATSGVACLVDFRFTPQRFTPGFEHRLSNSALTAVYAALAVGMAAGALALRERYAQEEEKERAQRLEEEYDRQPRIVRRIRAGRT